MCSSDLFPSHDKHQGVDCHDEDKGAGDIGIMFGGATLEAPDYTGHSHYIAKVLSKGLHDLVVQGENIWGRPDIKTQVSIRYEDKIPVAVDNVVICISHAEDKDLEEIREEITIYVKEVLADYNHSIIQLGRQFLDIQNVKVLVNPTGRFAIFGPASDAGEVGRKIVVDQMGGHFSVGGGNLNGKDATKVDRSGVYISRSAAKHIVASGLATKAQVQVSYAIGVAKPTSVCVETFGTSKVDEGLIEEKIKELVDFRPGAIINKFKLNKPSSERGFLYSDLGAYGHIGTVGINVPWEEVDDRLIELLKF